MNKRKDIDEELINKIYNEIINNKISGGNKITYIMKTYKVGFSIAASVKERIDKEKENGNQ